MPTFILIVLSCHIYKVCSEEKAYELRYVTFQTFGYKFVLFRPQSIKNMIISCKVISTCDTGVDCYEQL